MEVFFDGNYREWPQSVEIRFFHESQKPGYHIHGSRFNATRIVTSSKIYKLLYEENDPRFEEYREPRATGNPSTAQIIDKAVNYIRACSTPIARDIEPACSSIGGVIHAATITKAYGFRWEMSHVPVRAILPIPLPGAA